MLNLRFDWYICLPLKNISDLVFKKIIRIRFSYRKSGLTCRTTQNAKCSYLSAYCKLHYLGCHVDLPRMQHVAIFLHVANSTPLSPPCNASSPQLSPSPASSCIRHEQFPWGILLNKIEQKSNQTAGVWLDSAIKQKSNILPVFRCKFDLRTNQQNLTVLWC